MKNLTGRYELVKKTIYFKKEKILAFGDLHLGYDHMLNRKGLELSTGLTKRIKKELIKIFKIIGKNKIKKIIILGDITHNFKNKKQDLIETKKIINFIKKAIPKSKIILIKGNHDKTKDKNYKSYYINKDLFFSHGDKLFKEMLNKNIKIIVTCHLHPTITLQDKSGIKKEKFKVYLEGRWKDKKIIILPSFFPFTEGINPLEISKLNEDNQLASKIDIENMKVYVVGKDKNYEFGKLKEFI